MIRCAVCWMYTRHEKNALNCVRFRILLQTKKRNSFCECPTNIHISKHRHSANTHIEHPAHEIGCSTHVLREYAHYKYFDNVKVCRQPNSSSSSYYLSLFFLVLFHSIVQCSYFQLSFFLSFYMEVKDSMYSFIHMYVWFRFFSFQSYIYV